MNFSSHSLTMTARYENPLKIQSMQWRYFHSWPRQFANIQYFPNDKEFNCWVISFYQIDSWKAGTTMCSLKGDALIATMLLHHANDTTYQVVSILIYDYYWFHAWWRTESMGIKKLLQPIYHAGLINPRIFTGIETIGSIILKILRVAPIWIRWSFKVLQM